MDVAAISMGLSNSSLASAVSLSVIKLQMNNNDDLAKGMEEMMNNMAVDPNRGINLDIKA